jgi:hypothetical protein
VAVERVPLNDKIVQAARVLLAEPKHRRDEKLKQIVNGRVKSIDANWWRKMHGVVPWQVVARAQAKFQAKLDALAAMADPARNLSAHRRRAAEDAFAKLKAVPSPELACPPAPGLEAYERELARSHARQDRILREAFKPRSRPLPTATVAVKPKAKAGKRGPGRPFAGGRDPIVGVRMPPEERKAVEAWAKRQDDEPTLSVAIRRLVQRGLASD